MRTIRVSNGALTDEGGGVFTVDTGVGGTGDASTSTAVSVDGEVAVFDGVSGKIVKRATGTGIPKLTNGVLGLAASADGEALVGDAGADAATKGVATFALNDFNAAAGVVSLDYTNGQKATAGQDGFLDNADFATFAAKQDALTASVDYATPGDVTTAVSGKVDTTRTISTTAPLGGGGDLSGNRTFTCATCTTNAAALTANAPMIGAGGQAAAVGSRSGNTTEFATVSGVKSQNKQLAFDASGNIVASTSDIGGGTGGHTIADEGVALGQQRTVLNFAGAGVSCADDTDKTTCTIAGGGATTFDGIGAGTNTNALLVGTGGTLGPTGTGTITATHVAPQGGGAGIVKVDGSAVPSVAVSGTDYARPVGINVRDYGAVGDGVTDDLTALQTAMTAAAQLTGPALVWLPTGIYRLSATLDVPRGVMLQGVGVGSTGHPSSTLLLDAGTDIDAVHGLCPANDDWYHWSGLRDVAIRKTAGADTLGHGLALAGGQTSCRAGEGFVLERVFIYGFPQAGIQLAAESVPLLWRDVHLFGNGTYGLDIKADGQSLSLQGISGDSNATALIRLHTGGGAKFGVALRDIKAEATGVAPTLQPTIVLLENLNGSPVHIANISGVTSGGATIEEMVKVTTSNARVSLELARCSGCTNLLTDTFASVSIPYPSASPFWVTYGGGRVTTYDGNGLSTWALGLGSNVTTPTTGGLLTQDGQANNVTLHTMQRFTDTAPTGNFADYRNAADTTSLWRVDIAGALQAGDIPAARISGTLSDAQVADVQSITTLSNLLTNGPVITTGGTGTLGVSEQVLTQSGLTWNVNTATCTGDPNGGTLTISGTEIVCAGDDGGGGGTAFSSITTASNTNQTLTVGTGSVLTTADTGTIVANRVAAGAAGIVKVDGSNVPSAAAAADVVAIFGGGTCTGYLKSDGSCDSATPADADDDEVTKGIATFTDAHFDVVAGLVSLNVTTGPTADSETKGFLTPNDFNAFSAKAESSLTLDVNGTTNEIEVAEAGPLDLTANRAWTVGIPNNAQLHVAKLTNLVTDGLVTTSGGDGTLAVVAAAPAAVGLGNVANVAQLTRAAGDFSTGIDEKLAPIAADRVLIEDSAAGNAKKYAQLGNLPGAAGSKHVVQDEGGAGLTPRTNLNCVGAGITCSDDAGGDATVITVGGGAGGGGGVYGKDFTNVGSVSIPVTEHNLGTDVQAVVYDNSTPRVEMIAQKTVAANGDVVVTMTPNQTGRVVITGGASLPMLTMTRLYLHSSLGGL